MGDLQVVHSPVHLTSANSTPQTLEAQPKGYRPGFSGKTSVNAVKNGKQPSNATGHLPPPSHPATAKTTPALKKATIRSSDSKNI